MTNGSFSAPLSDLSFLSNGQHAAAAEPSARAAVSPGVWAAPDGEQVSDGCSKRLFTVDGAGAAVVERRWQRSTVHAPWSEQRIGAYVSNDLVTVRVSF